MDTNIVSAGSRERIAVALIFGVFFLLAGGLIKLQIFEHAKMLDLAERNRIRVVPIEAKRGVVYDREGRVIIGNRPSYTVSVVPAEEVKGKTLLNLSSVVAMDTTAIRRRMRRNQASPFQPSPVYRDIPFEVVAVLEEQSTEFPGVNYTLDRVRQYDLGLRPEAFTGHVGEVSETEMQKNPDAGYRMGVTVGKKGIEKQYDQVLRGVEGTEFIEVTALGEILGQYSGKSKVQPVPGADLVLTIDADVQRAAIEGLDSFAVKHVLSTAGGDSLVHFPGAVVALDPRTGEILAMTSSPGFDPNVFSGVITDSLWRTIQGDSTHPLLNRPLNGLYPPGSTAKLVTLGAGLESGVIDEHSTFRSCIGGYQFGNRFFRCWEKKGHGTTTGVHAVEMSCDVYFYQLGLKLGVDQLSRYYELCGFAKPTGIDLPNEAKGLIPSSKYYDKRYGKNGWTRALVLNTAIGQGEVLVTPLQLAQFFGGIAMWGKVYRPHMVRQVVKPNGEVQIIEPEESFELPFSRHTLALMREGVRLVVEGGRGTARRLKNDLYGVGGKTGTAQNPHGNDHAWFVGYAPLDNPEIVCCAIVENAGHGSTIAAPVVGRVIEVYMKKKLGLLNQEIAAADSTGARP